MADFDYSNPAHRKTRSFRTRAIAARLYAEDGVRASTADTWAFIAQSWNDLAALREAAEKTDARIAESWRLLHP